MYAAHAPQDAAHAPVCICSHPAMWAQHPGGTDSHGCARWFHLFLVWPQVKRKRASCGLRGHTRWKAFKLTWGWVSLPDSQQEHCLLETIIFLLCFLSNSSSGKTFSKSLRMSNSQAPFCPSSIYLQHSCVSAAETGDIILVLPFLLTSSLSTNSCHSCLSRTVMCFSLA